MTLSLLNSLYAAFIFAAVACTLSALRWRTRSRGHPLPPGPKRLPLVGNLHNLPTTWTRFKYRDLAMVYGDVLYFEVLGQSILVLNSATAIVEYLEKNATNTSDRPQFGGLIDLMGATYNLGVLPYGEAWRNHRRVFWQYFHGDAVRAYQPTQLAVARIFLERLLTSPDQVKQHIRANFANSILHVTYGVDYATGGLSDSYAEAMESALSSLTHGLVPGRFMVQYFPFLRYLPSWLPGTGWQKRFEQWREMNHTSIAKPYEYTRSGMGRLSDLNESVVGQHIERLSSSGSISIQNETTLMNAAGVAFAAGTDTTKSTLQGVILALSLNPQVVKRAQEELDLVVGSDRLPDFEDEPDLLYVRAVIMEALRWHNVIPLGGHHGTIDDDVWRGWFIPRGTIILPNVWACMHDPEMFPDPFEFRPERFLKDGKIDTNLLDPLVFVFGYGRRICPGRHFARAALFINVASILHVFNFSAPLDEQGKPIKIEPRFTDGFLSYPEDMRCTIAPRSEAFAELIRVNAGAARAS